MRICLIGVALSLLTGCLTATSPTVTYWTVMPSVSMEKFASPKYGVVRLAQVLVRAPYDTRQITVRRADGSLAFDPYNQFAAQPSQMFKPAIIVALGKSGICKMVVGSASSARVNEVAEVVITDLALSSGADGAMKANAAVLIRLLDEHRDIVAMSYASGIADVEGGSLTAAFSAAFDQAARKAISEL